jgi:DNA-binding MarR family transcriptional regulator
VLGKGRVWVVPRRPPARAFRRYGVPVSQSAWDSVDYLLDDWARERPDLDFTPVGVITRLGRVRTHVARQLAAVFADHGLTPADFRVLVNLRRSGAPYRMPQARLMEALGLTSGTVSVRLDRLAKAGTIAREPDPDDRRGSLIRLTEDGLRLFDALAPEHLANEDRLLSALTDEQRRGLADLLRHLLVSFENRPCPAAAELGLTLESAPAARARRRAVGLSDRAGLLVSAVEAGSTAESAGVCRGDLIVKINGQTVQSVAAFAEALDELTDGQDARLTVLRGNEPHDVRLRRRPRLSTPRATTTEQRSPQTRRRRGSATKDSKAPVPAKSTAHRKVNPQKPQRLK